MRDYELTVLIKPNLTEKELDKEVKLLSGFLEKNGAKLKKKIDPEKKALAYEVGPAREAFYVYLELSFDPSKVKAVEEKIAVTDNIIRHLLVLSQKSKIKR